MWLIVSRDKHSSRHCTIQLMLLLLEEGTNLTKFQLDHGSLLIVVFFQVAQLKIFSWIFILSVLGPEKFELHTNSDGEEVPPELHMEALTYRYSYNQEPQITRYNVSSKRNKPGYS